jgi:two-component system, LytTR family, sensor kinase
MSREEINLSARRVLELTCVILALWLAAAIFNTSEFYRRSIVRGAAPDWDQVLYYQLSASLHWAVWTPLAMALADVLAIRAPNRLRNTLLLVAIVPPLGLIRAALGGVVLQWGEGGPITLGMMALSVGIRWHRYTFIFLIIIVMTNFLRVQREAITRERQGFALEAALARAEAEQLRSQLHPDFLFGALEAIESSIRRSPAEADHIIVNLSSLLRRSLDFRRRESVTLEEELDFIDQYIDIQRARFGQIAVTMNASDEALAALVPPQAVYAIVDRLLTPDPNKARSANVEVAADRDGDTLRVTVKTDGVLAGELVVPYQVTQGVAA